MIKMSEMAAFIEERRRAGVTINDVANWLIEAFSIDVEPETEAAPAKGPKHVLAFEDVRAIMADKSRESFTAQIRELLQKIWSQQTLRDGPGALEDADCGWGGSEQWVSTHFSPHPHPTVG